MTSPTLLLAHVDVHAATVIEHLLAGWRRRDLDPQRLEQLRLDPGERAGLVVLQGMGDEEELVEACGAVRQHPALRDARLLVALDPDLALQYGPARAAGADECLMVPASSGHVETLLRRLLGSDYPQQS